MRQRSAQNLFRLVRWKVWKNNYIQYGKVLIWQGSLYERGTQRSEYARIYHDRVLNISGILNMTG